MTPYDNQVTPMQLGNAPDKAGVALERQHHTANRTLPTMKKEKLPKEE